MAVIMTVVKVSRSHCPPSLAKQERRGGYNSYRAPARRRPKFGNLETPERNRTQYLLRNKATCNRVHPLYKDFAFKKTFLSSLVLIMIIGEAFRVYPYQAA